MSKTNIFSSRFEGTRGEKPNISHLSEKADLRRHVESVHEGKRPHKCNVCGKSFTEKKFMLKHIDTVHEGNKPFKCESCERTFAHKGNMKKHILQGISYQLEHS